MNRIELTNGRGVSAARGRLHGMSIAELMISLVISAMLLTAIAVAYVSSSAVIENNDRFFRATQASRVALTQMLAEVRRCHSIPIGAYPHVMSSTKLPIMRPPDGPMQPNEDVRVYEYIPADKKLVLFFRYLNATESPRYPIASNVQLNPFVYDQGVDSNNDACVVRVSINLQVKVENQTIHLSGSAAPRRSGFR
jgi:type II secretory pathway pseudopilin PulG